MKTELIDLKKRCIKFVGLIVKLTSSIKDTGLRFALEGQIIRSSSSIGANLIEGNGGVTKKDWLNYMNIARKSALETIYWLEVIEECANTVDTNLLELSKKESVELAKIFTSITRTGSSRYKNNKH